MQKYDEYTVMETYIYHPAFSDLIPPFHVFLFIASRFEKNIVINQLLIIIIRCIEYAVKNKIIGKEK